MGDSVKIVEITKIKYWHGNFEEPNLIFVELKTTSCAGSSIVQCNPNFCVQCHYQGHCFKWLLFSLMYNSKILIRLVIFLRKVPGKLVFLDNSKRWLVVSHLALLVLIRYAWLQYIRVDAITLHSTRSSDIAEHTLYLDRHRLCT